MQIPPNMGKEVHSREFRSMYPDLAKHNNISLVPFILEGVGGRAELNLEDGIHPTAEGHRSTLRTMCGAFYSDCYKIFNRFIWIRKLSTSSMNTRTSH